MDLGISLILPIILEPWPISSSGHAQLALHFVASTASYMPVMQKILDHLVYGPIFLIVLLFFGKSFFYHWYYQHSWPERIRTVVLVLCADIITFCLYGIWAVVGKNWMPLWFGFGITALCLLATRWVKRNKMQSLTFGSALILGCVQGLSLLPGISRFGTTFLAARFLGFSAQYAFDLSFLLLLPISAGGFLLGLRAWYFLPNELFLATPITVALLGGAMLLAWLGFNAAASLVRSNRLWLIGLYECIPLLVALMLGL